MKRNDDTVKRRTHKHVSLPSSRSNDGLPAGPIWSSTAGTSETVEIQTFRPPTIKRVIKKRVAVVRPNPSDETGDLRLDTAGTPSPKLRRSAQLQEYVEQLNDSKDVDLDNELARVSQFIKDQTQAAQVKQTADSSATPQVVIVQSDAPAGYRRTFVDVDLSQLVEPPIPTSNTRIDTSHLVGTDTSEPHLVYQELAENEDRKKVDAAIAARERAPKLGEPALPYASVTYDEKTADVIATISSAIASVIQDRSEEDLRQQAETYLQDSAKQLVEHNQQRNQSPAEEVATNPSIDDLDEEMLNDIVRQRIDQSIGPVNLGDILQERIDAHHEIVSQKDSIPFAEEVDAQVDFVARPITSFASFAETSDDNEAPVVVVSPPKEQQESTVADENDVPLNLAAWDVEDFRWPVVTNQMIVNGGNAIAGLLAAIVEQLPGVPRRVAISGVGRVQGATSISVGLARWAAAAGYRTLLIDADVASPSLSQRLGMASDISWLNGINNELPTSELIIRSKKSNLCVMPLASSVTRVTWPRFIFDNLGELLESVQRSFDLILVDSGPASQLLDELSSPRKLLDSVVVVNDSADEKSVETIVTRLTTFGIQRFVMADNRTVESKPNVA